MRTRVALLILLAPAAEVWAQRSDDITFQKDDVAIRKTQQPVQIFANEQPRLVSGSMFLYDRINYGIQFDKPGRVADYGKADVDFSRLATTYYHRESPIGIVLQKFNWFPGPINTYWADVRLPASLVSGMAQHATFYGLSAIWSEPPVAVVGLHLGTLASYARPFQHWQFTEHNPELIKLCQEPVNGTRYFHYVHDALGRGARINIDKGDGRLEVEKWSNGYFHVIVVEAILKGNDQKLREKLLTREGMKLAMGKLAPGGILCYHTSCRYYDLKALLGATAASLGLVSRVGADQPNSRNNAAFSSDWVMVARNAQDLAHLKEPRNYAENTRKQAGQREYWSAGQADERFVWSDEKNVYQGLYRGDPRLIRPLKNAFHDMIERFGWRFDSAFAQTVENALRSLEDIQVRRLNAAK